MPPRTLQVSTANTAFQHFEVLRRNRTKRHRHREFVVEGVRALNAAVAGGWTIRSFAFARGRALSRWATDLLEASTAESHFEMAPELFDQISEKTEPSELVAVVGMRDDSPDRIPLRAGFTGVVVDRPGSPGNLGTLIRSCDAFGVSGLIATGHAVDLYDPATIRASVGAFFTVPCITLASHRDVAEFVSRARSAFPATTVVGTSAHGATPIAEYEWSSEIILAIGNETNGLSHAYRELCDAMVAIPMRGTATSLNAAVAASIALYQRDSSRS
jgi:TrmH family RNA methyltransferase